MRVKAVLVLALAALCLSPVAEARKKALKVVINKSDVDLANRTIYFKLSRPCDSVDLQVFNEDGELISEKTEVYEGTKAGERLSVTWPALLPGVDNFRVDLKFKVKFNLVNTFLSQEAGLAAALPGERRFNFLRQNHCPKERYRRHGPSKNTFARCHHQINSVC